MWGKLLFQPQIIFTMGITGDLTHMLIDLDFKIIAIMSGSQKMLSKLTFSLDYFIFFRFSWHVIYFWSSSIVRAGKMFNLNFVFSNPFFVISLYLYFYHEVSTIYLMFSNYLAQYYILPTNLPSFLSIENFIFQSIFPMCHSLSPSLWNIKR